MAATPKLTVLFEKLRGKIFLLDKEKEVVTAGRRDNMDICIKDGTMSGHHCDFIRTPSGSYILRDNGSTNGTRVNNVPVTEQELKSSDIIQLGGVEMLYDCEDANPEPGSLATGSRTHTINLNPADMNLSTVRDLTNYSPFAKEESRKQATLNKTMLFAAIGMGAIIIILLLLFVFFALTDKRGTTVEALPAEEAVVTAPPAPAAPAESAAQ